MAVLTVFLFPDLRMIETAAVFDERNFILIQYLI